jgi:hypothetical protein
MTPDEDTWARGTVERTMSRRNMVQAQAAVANDVLWRRGYPLTDGNPPCDHPAFVASVNVTRLTATDDGPITGYSADIRIKCGRCGLPFRFLGAPGGLYPAHPTTSLIGDELRAPLAPIDPFVAALMECGHG